MNKNLGRVGVIGRFKPLHNGGASMLDALCENADRVIIGLGSSNKYDLRNPFTVEESAGMIQAYLSPRYSNYELIPIPDFGHLPDFRDGEEWSRYARNKLGRLDYFVTGNEYTASLLKSYYRILAPAEVIPEEKQVEINSTAVRIVMAKNENYGVLIPTAVSEYLKKKGLIERFVREFGEETINCAKNKNERSERLDPYKTKNLLEEKLKIQGVK